MNTKIVTMRFVVLSCMLAPASKEATYQVRFENQPEDARGYLFWEQDVLPPPAEVDHV